MGNTCSKQKSKEEAPCDNHLMNSNEHSNDVQQNNLKEYPENEQVTQNITVSSVIKQADDRWFYKMDSSHRGLAIIFNHHQYKYDRLPAREGTQYDKKSLETVFKKLGFEVHPHDDLTYSQICAVIEEAQQINHGDKDCFVLAVLTHGNIGGCLSAHDVDYSFTALWEPFTDENCPSLKGKPRLFFIQACRGNDVMDPIQLQQQTETDAIPYRSPIPNIAEHFLVAYATCEGFLSWRSPTDGTWFIQSLCEELEKYANVCDINVILTQVLRNVAIGYESVCPDEPTRHEKKQMPCIVTKLIYLVKFKRKV